MMPGRMRDMAAEYEQAAELFAYRYGNGLIHNGAFFGTGLIDLSQELLDLIEANPDAWEARIRDYCRAIAGQNEQEL